MDALSPQAEEASNRVIGAAFEVSNLLGHGFLEAVYRKALLKELLLREVPASEEVRFPVQYKGEDIGCYVADLVVAGCLIVELKAVEALDRRHVGQVLNYLRASGLKAGLLLNFGRPRVEVKRVLG